MTTNQNTPTNQTKTPATPNVLNLRLHTSQIQQILNAIKAARFYHRKTEIDFSKVSGGYPLVELHKKHQEKYETLLRLVQGVVDRAVKEANHDGGSD